MSASALKFQIGARTLASIPRRLVRVPLSLDQALAGIAPALPGLGSADGYLVTSLPDDAPVAWPGIVFERQRYTRYFIDLAAGHAAWCAGLSGQARATLRRKRGKLAAANAGVLDIRRYRTPAELRAFHAPARAVSRTTYQERLMDAGLPGEPGFADTRAAADAVRAWLMFLGDRPIAYLCCTADGDTLRYDHVGHDPAFGALSPGSVLLGEALGELFADRFRRFDFTEGEGQHKRALATGGVACRDLLLLRDTMANRAAVTAVASFDAAMRVAKRTAQAPALAGLARRVRR